MILNELIQVKLKVHLMGSRELIERIVPRIPQDQHCQLIVESRDAFPELLPTDSDVFVFVITGDTLASVFAWARTQNKTFDKQIAIVSQHVHTNDIVRLIRFGFSEVFDIFEDLALLNEWILHHYEQKLIAAQEQISSIRNSIPQTVIIGESESMKTVRRLAGDAGQYSDMTVLLQGATGTGKELVARYIHESSDRSAGPFVEVNCSAIPETLMEAEMFGYEKGAFTDARRTKLGFFEMADHGTLFLDEIGFMSLNLQNKMLKVIEEKHFRRIGGEKEIFVDVKVIAGTNINLDLAISKGEFRSDLYYRLKVFTIRIPSLRERPDDIQLLAEHFLDAVSLRYRLTLQGFHPSTKKLLQDFSWPGNVRELKHVVERAAVLARHGRILPSHLPEEMQMLEQESAISPILKDTEKLCIPLPADGISIETIERIVIREVLNRCSGNQSRAARLLKISRTRLLRKLSP